MADFVHYAYLIRHFMSCLEHERDKHNMITLWDRENIIKKLQIWLNNDQTNIIIQQGQGPYKLLVYNHWRDQLWQFYFEQFDCLPETPAISPNYSFELLNVIRKSTLFNEKPVYQVKFPLDTVHEYLIDIYLKTFLKTQSVNFEAFNNFICKTKHSNIYNFISKDDFLSMQLYSKIIYLGSTRDSITFNDCVSKFEPFQSHSLLSKYAYDLCNSILRWRHKTIKHLNSCELIKNLTITDTEQINSLDRRLAGAFIKILAKEK